MEAIWKQLRALIVATLSREPISLRPPSLAEAREQAIVVRPEE